MNDNKIPSCIADEITEVRRDFPSIKIQASTNSFLSGSYERSNPNTRVKFTLSYPDNYPDTPLIVNINEDHNVPPGLKKKLEKDFALDLPIGTHQQVITFAHRLVQFVNHNKFLPCWRELKQCFNLIRDDQANASANTNKSTISILEAKGKIKMRLCSGLYYYACRIIIDDNYPSTATHEDWGKACDLTMESTNFPPKIEKMLTSQAKELVRRMQDGMSSDKALKMSNPIQKPKDMDDDHKKGKSTILTQKTLKGLKKDIETLSHVRNLRQVDSATVQGDARKKLHDSKCRRDARRAIKKITSNEISKDIAEEQDKEAQWKMEEESRLTGYNLTEYESPQPSLLSLVTFLKQKIQLLPDEKCPICTEHALPSDPKELESLYKKSSDCKTEKERRAYKVAKQKRPVRVYCGHWYHYSCLDRFMREPPFGASCPEESCGRRVYHPDWGDVKALEREWAGAQARKREIEDAAMIL